jgi:hypothetical protein
VFKKLSAALLAAGFVAGGLFVAAPASAASNPARAQSLDVQLKSDRDALKAEKAKIKADYKARKAQLKAERAQAKKDGETLLHRLWPFGKHKEEEQVPFPQQKRFASGNPRDMTDRNGPLRATTTKVRKHRQERQQRDGMHFLRDTKAKKKAGAQNQTTASSRSDKAKLSSVNSHKNGEFRRGTHKHRYTPSGLNWNFPKKYTVKNKLNKDGKYRPTR